MVYALINLVIAQVTSLRDRLCSGHVVHGDSSLAGGNPGADGTELDWGGGSCHQPRPHASPTDDEPLNVERDSAEEDGGSEQLGKNQNLSQEPQGRSENARLGEGSVGSGNGVAGGAETQDPFGSWTTEDREKLLLCVAKIFQIQFPLYTAYKHNTHPTIEVRPLEGRKRRNRFAPHI